MKKLTALCCLLFFWDGAQLYAQTPSGDLFDGWGRGNWSIYFENDALNPGGLNKSDANYSQGLRLETLWDPGDSTRRFFRTLSLSLKTNYKKTGLLLCNSPALPPRPANIAHVENYFSSKTQNDVSGDGRYFLLNDETQTNQILYYSEGEGTAIVIAPEPGTNLIVVRSRDGQDLVHGYTGWPQRIGTYQPSNQDVCIIEVLSHDRRTGSDLLVWLPAEFYANHRFFTHEDGDVMDPNYFNTPQLLDGTLFPTNMFPYSPANSSLSAREINDIREFQAASDKDINGTHVLNGYAVGQFIYTPTELVRNSPGSTILEVRKALKGAYRPVAGMLFISLNSHSMRQRTGEYLFTETKLGVWGKYSYAREVQGAWHAAIGYTDNPIYKYQLDPGIPLLLQFAANYRKEFVNSSYGLKIGYVTGADVGTLMANANAGLLIKLGHFENQRLVKYSYQLSCRNQAGRALKFFGYAKPTVNVVAMNGLLSSSFFSSRTDDMEKLLPLSSINPVYLKFEVGFGLRIIHNITANYTWVAQGPEYNGQPNNMYSRVFIRVDY